MSTMGDLPWVNTYRLNVSDMNMEEFEYISQRLEEYVEDAAEYSTSCTDYPLLAKQDSHYLFQYGQMKDGFSRDRQMLGDPCIAVGWTKAGFRMQRHNSKYQAFPVITLDKDKSICAPVYGEIYQVSPEKIRELDWVESHHVITKRIKLPISAIVDSKSTEKQIYAFVYVHLNQYWDSRKDRLLDCELLTSNNNGKKYYNYMKKYEQQGLAA